jgi:uncharacterized protein (DUF885 family)
MTSATYQLCDTYVQEMAALDPVSATSRGILGHDAEMTDYSPEGLAARDELNRRVAAELARLEPSRWRDRVARDLLVGELDAAKALHDAGEDLRALRVIASPFQEVRQVFDIMPSETQEHWETIAARLAQVPSALAGLRSSLTEAVSRGVPPPRRQVLACAAQGEAWAGQRGDEPFFDRLVGRYAGHDAALAKQLQRAASAATEAYASAASWMRGELAALGSERDAVGRERYALFARRTLGATPDLLEIYAWGWEELHRLEAEMVRVAGLVVPGASVREAIGVLEADPSRAVQGSEALRSYLQDLIDRTVEQLDGVHFDIPAPLRRVEAMIAPPGGAAAMYYTGPSEDFSRPGRTWYPTLGKTVFPLWGEVSICYHEAVPGHHLQVGQVRYLRDELSRFQRTTFVSGHGEGWALYAERLMDELGYFDKPEFRLGFLREQVFRAVRVVVDLGMHLELALPAGEPFHPGEVWTPSLGKEFLDERSYFPPDFAASELDRYLGWPGQAICYKVGERAWLEVRAEARRRLGSAFDLKKWHAQALGAGPLLLDQFPAELAGGQDWPAREPS